MNRYLSMAASAAIFAALPVSAQTPAEPPTKTFPAPSEFVAAAKADDWVTIAPADLLVMDLTPDANGNPRRAVIQLMPPPFSQGWIGNIRKLAAAHWWDGTRINRVQDNYVTQWGDATEKKVLPNGLVAVPASEYVSTIDKTKASIFTKTYSKIDVYARAIGFERGWPLARGGKLTWPVHCYGMVGVGRNLSPDTGTGAELYAVIGHAPRHLDRNIALVGRVIEGMEHLSSLPRGTGALGFYEQDEERVPILSVRLASEMESDPVPSFEFLNTDSESFAKYADARANRRDPFFIKPAGGADICNIPVPVRRKAAN